MPDGIGHGIASGITNAISLALQSKSLDIREDRNTALIDQGERRTKALEGALELKRQALPSQQLKFETEQEQRIIERDTDKLELEQALEQEQKSKSYLSLADHLNQRVGESYTPDQEQAFGVFLDAMLPGQTRSGLYSEADVDQAFKSAMDPDDPAPGGAELIKQFFQAGITQSDNQVEVMKAELQKMMEKNPLLSTNPEALKADEKASSLAQGIQELTATSNQFKSQAAETDEFIIQAEDKKQAKINEANQARVDAIEVIQRARETKGTPPRTAEALMVEMSGGIAEATGRPRNEVLLDLMRPFEKQSIPQRVVLAALATGIEVPNVWNLTPETAEAILNKMDKSTATAFAGVLAEFASIPSAPFKLSDIPFIGRFLGGGATENTGDALDDVNTAQ